MIIETDIDVLTGPDWLYDMMNGYKNEKGTAELKPQKDPDGDYIISMNVLNDPDWQHLGQMEANGKKLQEWLTVKKFKYEEIE